MMNIYRIESNRAETNLEIIKEVIEINETTANIVEIMCKNSDYSMNQIKVRLN